MTETMLCEPLDLDKVEPFLTRDLWVAQPKLDGVRCLVYVSESGVRGYSRTGKPRSLPPSSIRTLSSRPGLVLDGEVVGDLFYAFDILSHPTHGDLRSSTLAQRLPILEDSLPSGWGVQLVPTAVSTDQKRRFLETIQKMGGEGLVFKNIRSLYVPSRSLDWRKVKLTKSCSCIVTDARIGGKDNLEVSLFDEAGNKRRVGKVKASPEQIASYIVSSRTLVVEVRYLKFTDGGRLREPVLLGFRDDIVPSDCTLDQVLPKPKSDPESLA